MGTGSDPSPVIDASGGREFLALGALVKRLIHPLTCGSDQLGVSLCLMEPGERILRHRHPYEEAYYVVEGTGRMYLEGEGEVLLKPARSVYIRPMRVHGQINAGPEPLVIVCSLSPPPVEGQVPELMGGEPEDGP
jgi:quercetin dioxygenase-like cupin family protein